MRRARSRGTARSRRNLALAGVDRAAADMRVGVKVHVGSGFGCDAGTEQVAVCVMTEMMGDTVQEVRVTVPSVLVVMTVTG